MKIGLLVAVIVLGLQGLNGLLEGLNAWVELGLKFAGLAAASGGAWKWMVGPGYRKLRAVVRWVGAQLELIGKLDDRLDSIEEELTRGHEHFARLDASFDSLASEEAQAVRRAMRGGDPVSMRPDDPGLVDRRDSERT